MSGHHLSVTPATPVSKLSWSPSNSSLMSPAKSPSVSRPDKGDLALLGLNEKATPRTIAFQFLAYVDAKKLAEPSSPSIPSAVEDKSSSASEQKAGAELELSKFLKFACLTLSSPIYKATKDEKSLLALAQTVCAYSKSVKTPSKKVTDGLVPFNTLLEQMKQATTPETNPSLTFLNILAVLANTKAFKNDPHLPNKLNMQALMRGFEQLQTTYPQLRRDSRSASPSSNQSSPSSANGHATPIKEFLASDNNAAVTMTPSARQKLDFNDDEDDEKTNSSPASSLSFGQAEDTAAQPEFWAFVRAESAKFDLGNNPQGSIARSIATPPKGPKSAYPSLLKFLEAAKTASGGKNLEPEKAVLNQETSLIQFICWAKQVCSNAESLFRNNSGDAKNFLEVYSQRITHIPAEWRPVFTLLANAAQVFPNDKHLKNTEVAKIPGYCQVLLAKQPPQAEKKLTPRQSKVAASPSAGSLHASGTTITVESPDPATTVTTSALSTSATSEGTSSSQLSVDSQTLTPASKSEFASVTLGATPPASPATPSPSSHLSPSPEQMPDAPVLTYIETRVTTPSTPLPRSPSQEQLRKEDPAAETPSAMADSDSSALKISPSQQPSPDASATTGFTSTIHSPAAGSGDSNGEANPAPSVPQTNNENSSSHTAHPSEEAQDSGDDELESKHQPVVTPSTTTTLTNSAAPIPSSSNSSNHTSSRSTPKPKHRAAQKPEEPQEPPLTAEEKAGLDSLKQKVQSLKNLRDALNQRLSHYEAAVFAQDAQAFATLLNPVLLEGAVDVPEQKELSTQTLVQQANQLRAAILVLKQELSQQPSNSAASTAAYQQELAALSQELNSLSGYKIQLRSTRPNDKEVDWQTLYVYPEKGAVEYAVKSAAPKDPKRTFATSKPFLPSIKRVTIDPAHSPAIAAKLQAKQYPPLLSQEEAAALFYNPKNKDGLSSLFREIDPISADISDMSVQIASITSQNSPAARTTAIQELALKSHPNHPELPKGKAHAATIDTAKAKEEKDITLSAEKAQLTNFVAGKKQKHRGLWENATAERAQPSASAHESESKEAKFTLRAITSTLAATGQSISEQIMGQWESEQAGANVKLRMQTRIAQLSSLLTPLTTLSLLEFQKIQGRYLGDIGREFTERFSTSVEMDKRAGNFYDFFVMAAEICKGNVTADRVLNQAITCARPVLLTQGIQTAILASFVAHNDTLVTFTKKLDERLKVNAAEEKPLTSEDLTYSAFIMETYPERLFGYLKIYEETFPDYRTDATYQQILTSFEQVIASTANLYLQYAKVRQANPALCSQAESPAKHQARLEEYQRLYTQVIKPQLHGQDNHKTSTDKALDRAVWQAKHDAKSKRVKTPKARTAAHIQPATTPTKTELQATSITASSHHSAEHKDATVIAEEDFSKQQPSMTAVAMTSQDAERDNLVDPNAVVTVPATANLITFTTSDASSGERKETVIDPFSDDVQEEDNTESDSVFESEPEDEGESGRNQSTPTSTPRPSATFSAAVLGRQGNQDLLDEYQANDSDPFKPRKQRPWWLRLAALLGISLLISTIGVLAIATFAPQLLLLPLLATVLSYAVLTNLGGIIAGTVAVGVALTLLALPLLLLFDFAQNYLALRQRASAKMDVELAEIVVEPRKSGTIQSSAPPTGLQPVSRTNSASSIPVNGQEAAKGPNP